MFTEPGEFYKYLQGLIDRHGNDLSIILNHLGIAAPATPERLLAAYDRAPMRFIQLLSELKEDFLPFSGLSVETMQTLQQMQQQASSKTSFLDKLFALGKKVVGRVSAARQSGTTSNAPPIEEKVGFWDLHKKKIIVIAVIIVVVLIVTLVWIKKIKK